MIIVESIPQNILTVDECHTLQFYSASFTEDLRQVVKHVGELLPNSRLYAAGWSLGGNILVRYLGQASAEVSYSLWRDLGTFL